METTPLNKSPKSSVEELVRTHGFEKPIFVTKPTLPSLEAYAERLQPAWESALLTNNGVLHGELQEALKAYLKVEHLNLCCNGTVALLLALQSARITGGEVITTPFTFPATSHALYWNHVKPVFCDVTPHDFNLDPERIESLISTETRAILPVHVFGHPCDVEAIQDIADRHGLMVMYDAAHTMGVDLKGRSILDWGDYSILSFHATKLFSTAEGGAVVSRSEAARIRVDHLKNFGIADQETVIGPGINGKMNELQAAFGLLQLESIDQEIANRAALTTIYRDRLRDVPGLTFHEDRADVRHNYAYFTLLVDEEAYGLSRDELWRTLKEFNVVTRKYFHPLCSHFPCYSALPSAAPSNLPVAEDIARRILSMPLYGSLEPEAVERICAILTALSRA